MNVDDKERTFGCMMRRVTEIRFEQDADAFMHGDFLSLCKKRALAAKNRPKIVIRKAALRGLPSPFGWAIADSAGIDPIFHIVHLSLRYNTIIQFFRKKINGFSKENIV